MTSEQRIARLEAENKDLKRRLKDSLAMDAIAESQAIKTLKSTILQRLRLEMQDYDDYIVDKNEFSQNEILAMKDSLHRVFRVIKQNCMD